MKGLAGGQDRRAVREAEGLHPERVPHLRAWEGGHFFVSVLKTFDYDRHLLASVRPKRVKNTDAAAILTEMMQTKEQTFLMRDKMFVCLCVYVYESH